MVSTIADRPMAGAFAIDGSTFSFYAFGLIQPGDGNCLRDGATPNHQMAVVGIDLIGSESTIETEETHLEARYKTLEDFKHGCQGEGEF